MTIKVLRFYPIYQEHIAEIAAERDRREVDEKRCRTVLEQEALAGNAGILYYLFFAVDTRTGLPHVHKSDDNDILLEKLCGKGSRPGVRAVCAVYAAAIGKIAFAESICTEVCDLSYLGKQSDEENAASPKQDSELLDARIGSGCLPGVLSALFYQVRTKKAFRIILERSDAARAIRFGYDIPPAWRSLRHYSLATWELDYADGLIKSLKDFEKRIRSAPVI